LGGFDAAELEECTRQNEECANVTETCKKLLDSQLPLPRYFYTVVDYTPDTADLDTLIAKKSMVEVESDVFLSTYSCIITADTTVTSDQITFELIEEGSITSVAELVVNSSVLVSNEREQQRGLYIWSGTAWTYQQPGLPTYRDMFRFAPGDVASFRSVSAIRQYEAVKHITPMLDLEVYYDNGLFTRTDVDATVDWYDPTYNLEDVIFTEKRGSTSFFRAIRSFTPPTERTVWNNSVSASTPRIEEIFGNVLKFVRLAECGDSITSRIGDNASTVKLGTCQLNLVPKAYGTKVDTFVFESTATLPQAPALSDNPASTFSYGPVDYGTGTLAL
jgi:hypothetical protein